MSKPVRIAALIEAVALSCGTASAESLFAFLASPSPTQVAPQAAAPAPDDERDEAQLDPRLKRQIVGYPSKEAPGTIIIDTPHTFLYYVLGNGKALRYGIGVGREGFTVGREIDRAQGRVADWYPPPEMVARQLHSPHDFRRLWQSVGRARCISPARNIASMAPTRRPRSVGTYRAVAFVSRMKT